MGCPDVLDDIVQTNEVDVSILDMYSLKCWEVDRKLKLQRVHTFRNLAFQSGVHEKSLTTPWFGYLQNLKGNSPDS